MKKQAHSSPCFGLKRVGDMYKGQRYSAGRTEWCENLPTGAKDSTTCWFYGVVATSFSLSGHQGVYFTQHVSASGLAEIRRQRCICGWLACLMVQWNYSDSSLTKSQPWVTFQSFVESIAFQCFLENRELSFCCYCCLEVLGINPRASCTL